ncbi:hypothetical protein ACFQ60_09445 [Streptomyces zhihengii]
MTRPLGVTGVTNPLPASGGADADGPGLTRRNVPSAVSALDRLVSVGDYEDFARSRAGIGRAVARELFDGRRRVLHVTVAGWTTARSRTTRRCCGRCGPRSPATGTPGCRCGWTCGSRCCCCSRRGCARSRTTAGTPSGPGCGRRCCAASGPGSVNWGRPHCCRTCWRRRTGCRGRPSRRRRVRRGGRLGGRGGSRRAGGACGAGAASAVPAGQAAYEEVVHRVTAEEGETLTDVVRATGVPLARLLRLNPDVTDTGRLAKGVPCSCSAGSVPRGSPSSPPASRTPSGSRRSPHEHRGRKAA